MTVSPLRTEYFAEYGVWVDFAGLTCDYCPATYPPDGRVAEWPSVAYEAERSGWQVMALTLLACCPGCHQQIVEAGS